MSTAAPVAPAKPKRVRKPKSKTPSATIEHVHVTREIVSLEEFTPPHPERRETPEFEHTRHQLVEVLDKPCRVCGVRQSVLSDPAKAEDKTANPASAKLMEAHHDPIEWSMVDAVDWRKVHLDYPQVVSQQTLLAFLDSAANMTILCDVHHVGPIGYHHVTYPDARIQPYLLDGYVVAGSQKNEAQAESADEQIEQQTGIEQAVDAQDGAAPDTVAAPVAAPSPAPERVDTSTPKRTARRKRASRKAKKAAPDTAKAADAA